MKDFFKKAGNHFMDVVKIDKSPHSIALGFAVGTFIAIFPTAGLDIPIAILAMLIYPKMNKLSLFGSFLFWNPLFSLPVILFSYKIGGMLFADSSVTGYSLLWLNQFIDISRKLLVGLAINSVIISTLSYFIVRLIAQIYQGMKHSKRKK